MNNNNKLEKSSSYDVRRKSNSPFHKNERIFVVRGKYKYKQKIT